MGRLPEMMEFFSSTIRISLFYTTLTFPEAQTMRSVDITIPYMRGATIDYPFYSYKSYFEILANKEKDKLHKIPVSLTFLGMLQSVEFIPILLPDDNLYKISIEIFTRRSPTTIEFSLFTVLIMWALSIAIGIIAIQVIGKYRGTDEHVLTLGITTLFALPALRETQPMSWASTALRWKQPSIEKEIELVQKQHDFQSRLISEMAIPMPLPITGGSFYDYRIRKKDSNSVKSRNSSTSPVSTTACPGSPKTRTPETVRTLQHALRIANHEYSMDHRVLSTRNESLSIFAADPVKNDDCGSRLWVVRYGVDSPLWDDELDPFEILNEPLYTFEVAGNQWALHDEMIDLFNV
ncbi:MAG: hypothetical protein J3Q66DRAFT_396840 [Benniella sp.]|nr:MAG: hypothetical protein J3Q66DRAFT_396840 [Benniella sp.]